ncbi:MAG: S1 RNA-binding domain-containing protein [Thermodesulfobacteriota bacterium]
MTDNQDNDLHDDAEESDFAALLDNYTSGMNENIKAGDRIQGKIIAVGKDTVDIDTGTKLDGVISKTELLNEKGEFTFKKGDLVDLYVVSLTESEILLSKVLTGIDSSHLLLDAFQNKIPVEGKVSETCKGGFHVDIMKKRAFCPISQMDIKYVKDPNIYVGNSYHFVITRYEHNGRNIVVSRRDQLEKDLEAARRAFIAGLSVGALLEGRVIKTMPFGVFVELFPGIEGMVHISELSWSRVAAADDILKVDETAVFKVIGLEMKESGKVKVALSLKQADADPWETIDNRFHAGDQVSGKVTRCAAFGAFVEIAPGLEGLVHISEMSYLKRILRPEDVVSPGDTVSVLIKEIDKTGKRIALSMRDAEGDPWNDIQQKYKIGQAVVGTLVKKEKYGYFITLEPGITGLYPKSRQGMETEEGPLESLKPGQPVTVAIEAVLPAERRITLGPLRTTGADDWRTFSSKTDKPVGDLAAKLHQALSGKKQE